LNDDERVIDSSVKKRRREEEKLVSMRRKIRNTRRRERETYLGRGKIEIENEKKEIGWDRFDIRKRKKGRDVVSVVKE
jgi:hypothetical protein